MIDVLGPVTHNIHKQRLAGGKIVSTTNRWLRDIIITSFEKPS